MADLAKYHRIVAARDRLHALFRSAAERQRAALAEGARLRRHLTDDAAHRAKAGKPRGGSPINLELASAILARRGPALGKTTQGELEAAGLSPDRVASVFEIDQAASDAAAECRDLSARLAQQTRLVDSLTDYLRRTRAMR